MTAWEQFFKEKVIRILESSGIVIDFGGGLRLSRDKSDREDPKNAFLKPYANKVDYKIFDISAEYNPDIIGDIHALPFADSTIDGYVCLAVLEHVKNPIVAMSEMFRTLKPGGKILIYVPFLFYYHNHEGNHTYGDYWRFTSDTLRMLAEPFASFELCSVKQPIETLVSLTPLTTWKPIVSVARFLDSIFYKKISQQTSGYYLYVTK